MSLQGGIFAEQVENDITLFSKDARRKRDQKLNGVPSREFVESTNSFRLDSACAAMGGEERRSPPGSPEHLRMRQVKSAPAVELYRPPAARRAGRNGSASASVVPAAAEASSYFGKGNRHRRPDRAVYVPKHRRSTESDEIAQTPEASRKPSSPSNINGNGQASSRSWNKEDSIKRSASSCSSECCNKNDDNLGQSSREESTPVEQQLFLPAELDQDNTVSTGNSIVCSETSRDSMECASGSLSASSDETVISTTRRYRIRKVYSSISREHSGDELASSDARRNSDVEIIPECSSSSDSREKKREERESLNRDDQVNNKNFGSLNPCIVSKVLKISDRKEQRLEEKSVNVEKETMPVNSPEKKLKKVARVKSKPASPPAPPVKLNRDECDWDSLFDDNGECLDPTLIEELTAAVGEVTIEPPRNDYKAFSRPVEVSNDELGHVVEIYNFPSDFKTSDLAVVFSPWKNGGFEFKWVDDTHCLGVFSSPLVASEVLASDHPYVKTRPLSAATTLSKTKARKSAEFLQPYKSRPETCAALARRLVTGALGVKLATASQEREQEKAVLRKAKEKRRLANKQREDVWEGIIAEK